MSKIRTDKKIHRTRTALFCFVFVCFYSAYQFVEKEERALLSGGDLFQVNFAMLDQIKIYFTSIAVLNVQSEDVQCYANIWLLFCNNKNRSRNLNR